MNWMSSDFFFDYTGWLAQFSGNERKINLFNRTRGELLG
jgi:hypothetical protein